MYGLQYGEQYAGGGGSAGGYFTKTLTDAINVTSSLLRSIGKLVINTINTTEIFLKGISLTKILTDSIQAIDSGITIVQQLCLLLIDSIGLTSLLSIASTLIRSFTDSISTSEVFTKLRTAFKVLIDSIIVNDVYSRVLSYLRTLIDSIRASESYIMRLNGYVIHWTTIVRNMVGTWTDKVKSTASWTSKTRVSSSWTDKEREL